MKGESKRLLEVWGAEKGWFWKVLRTQDEIGAKLPCDGKQVLYGYVDKSPVARRAAAQNCLTGNNGGPCPILEKCAKAGKDSGYSWNVWGGYYQSKPVAPLTPAVVSRWMMETLRQTDSSKILMTFSLGIPSLRGLLNSEGGSDLLCMVDECLSLRVPDPRTAVLLRRRVAVEALLLQGNTPGTAMIELSCKEYSTCVSPWHMVWTKEPVNINIIPYSTSSRQIALSIYLTMCEGWTSTNSGEITGINRLYVAQVVRVAEAIGMDEPFVTGQVSDAVTWYTTLTDRRPAGQEIGALLTLMRAGQELSCMTVREILAVGKEEY